MYRIACLLIATVFTFLYPSVDSRADEQEVRKIIRQAKAATAFAKTSKGYSGTAFCFDSVGWFVTDRHLLAGAQEGAEITLVLNSGETDEQVSRRRKE